MFVHLETQVQVDELEYFVNEGDEQVEIGFSLSKPIPDGFDAVLQLEDYSVTTMSEFYSVHTYEYISYF